ncbi:tRNA pseudouridine(13) synthase TruD [Leptospira borgpetersenii]|uniref:tRNA pseudouridine(13) synthase TruD n=1 Tax=Leptospira borgpetersenii TaxID=174 RepID=UPI00187FE814|nr:tRNA pseudouridine(13) synthase TruD [Leptospira borgpetersenii serovar Balcanica]MBE8368558.1 tRNA pseudouridine(13) synthase TruD [Leptospira borgpetersenii serovar Balcanica]MBE8424069.1 tRNA pseudouridine(13) synthase TruD [Leptospira borgpetersenii serovar Balcanica]MBF3351179.1 tRNA pseudouridine(13) synthase TruD [Leptospira borgpetersenii serovar Balcanica]
MQDCSCEKFSYFGTVTSPLSGFLVYDLKQNPEDFRVEEILRPGFIQKSGKWTIFRLHKSGWNTLDALLKISKESKVSISEIGYAGKKDRHANTSQYLSCQRPLKIPKEFANVLQLEKIGFSEKSLSPEANAGNRFVLILRNLLEKEIESVRNNFEKIGKNGFINYYDSQRFSRFHPEFRLPIFPYLKGDAETCLKLILTDPYAGEKKQTRDRKKKIQVAWGNWSQCKKWSNNKLENKIFFNLSREKNPTQKTYSTLILQFPEEELLMLISSMQSLIWNEFVSELLVSEGCSGVRIKTKTGFLFFPGESSMKSLPSFRNLPVPGEFGIYKLEYSKKEVDVLRRILDLNGLNEAVFDHSPFPGIKMNSFERKMNVIPENFQMTDFEDDDLHPGKRKVKISFQLPSGAYATMLVKRLMLRANI